MLAGFRRSIRAVLTSDWTVTLTATMVGVFAGIYLNEYFTQSSLERESKQAVKQIKQEMTSNQAVLEETYKVHKKYLPVFKFYFENVDDNGDLVVSSSKMTSFQQQHPRTIVLTDSQLVKNNFYRYEGEIDMQFEAFATVQLSDIAWQTLQNSRLSSGLDYECLYNLAAMYRLQEHVKSENANLLNTLAEATDDSDVVETVLGRWKLLLGLEESLINLYNASPEMIQNCR